MTHVIKHRWALTVFSDISKTTVNSSDEIRSKDQRLLRIILENHIIKNKVVLGQLYNGQHLETIGGRRLRVFIYRTVCPLLSSQVLPRNDGWHQGCTVHYLRPHSSSCISATQLNRFWINLVFLMAGCVH